MNAHTQRLMEKMIDLLNEYMEKRSTLLNLVNGLEGNMNAIEEKIPESFQTEWYIFWGGLEQILAIGTEKIRQKEISEDINALKKLIKKFVTAQVER